MNENNYQLTPDNNPRPRKRGLVSKITVTAAGAAVLVLATMYAPLFWQSPSVAAKPATLTQIAGPLAQTSSSLIDDQAALAALYEAISPSVVSIQVESTAQAVQMPNIPGFQLPQDTPQMPQSGEGSGFIFDNDGHIVTNNHVVEGADKVTVVFTNGMWAKAEVVAMDPQADIAVLKVTPPAGITWKPLAIAEDGTLKVGHTVIAIGNPFGFENTMTTGIVSALGRTFPTGAFGTNRYALPDVIQTDAAINPGNSGGPLLDLNGNVVGVNFAIESPVRSSSGVGFAIPASIVKRVAAELIKDGKFNYAYLGLQGTTITAQLAEALGLADNNLGVYVSAVVPGGPSEKGGIKGADQTAVSQSATDVPKGGDIVTAIGDQPVRRFEDLVSFLVTKAAPGDKVTLTVLRDGKEEKVDVVLGERPTETVAAGAQGMPSMPSMPGQPSEPNQPDQQSQMKARAAIAVAEAAVKDKGVTGDIIEKVATPDQRDGKSVWVVELSTADKQATVVVDAVSGDVVEVTVK